MTFGSNPRRPVRDYAFFCILALGAALRLYHVTAPFLDAHAWRQLDTAAMARNFYEGPFFPLDPRVDWGGRSGYLEAEFPLVPAVIARPLSPLRAARDPRTPARHCDARSG